MEAWNEADVGSCSFMTELARTDGTKIEKLNGGLGMGVWEWGMGMGVWDWS